MDHRNPLKEVGIVAKDESQRVWTVAEAKVRLSEILRLAETEGPQYIGTQRPFVVVPADAWHERTRSRQPLGRWLVENMPRGVELELPDRHESERRVPLIDQKNR